MALIHAPHLEPGTHFYRMYVNGCEGSAPQAGGNAAALSLHDSHRIPSGNVYVSMGLAVCEGVERIRYDAGSAAVMSLMAPRWKCIWHSQAWCLVLSVTSKTDAQCV